MTLERRRDRYGPARPRPSLWAGHKAAEAKLLASGHAYRDFARPEEFDEERKAGQVAGKPHLYSRRFAAFDDETARHFEAEGRQSVVRLKMPRDGALVIDDKVRGRVKFAWEREQDHVIQRADGSCLYHLASVVDDHGLAMTHVIRAEEHLSNTPRQAFIALSLGYELPTYAHLPLVAGPGSRTKLSKRKLALMLPFLVKAKLVSDPPSAAAVTMVRKVIEASGDRLKVSGDIVAYADFFLVDEPPMDESAVKQRLAKPSAGELLGAYAKALEAAEPFEPAAIEAALKQAVQAAGVKVGDLVHAVRVAVTGKTVGPGLYDCLAILGREQSLARIARPLPRCG